MADETSASFEEGPQPRSLANMFWRDLLLQTPIGAWALMLGLPHLNVHGVGYVEALLAHLLLGASLSAMRLGVRLESEIDAAAWRLKRKGRSHGR